MIRFVVIFYLLLSLVVLVCVRSIWQGFLLGDIVASLILAIPIMLYLVLVLVSVGWMISQFRQTKFDRTILAFKALSVWTVICLIGIFGRILIEQLSWRLVEFDPTNFVAPYFLSFITAVFGAMVVYIPVVVVGIMLYGFSLLIYPKKPDYTHHHTSHH